MFVGECVFWNWVLQGPADPWGLVKTDGPVKTEGACSGLQI